MIFKSITPKSPVGTADYFFELAAFHKKCWKEQSDLLLSENKKYAEYLAGKVKLARDMQFFESRILFLKKQMEFHEGLFKSNAVSFTDRQVECTYNQ
jgi:hypothetical protein